MKLCGVAGRKQRGKNSLADSFIDSWSGKVYQYAFADALKDEAYEYLLKHHNIPRSHLDDPEHKEDYRVFLQWYGSDFKRKLICDSYWLDKVRDKILAHQDEDCLVFVTDVRYLNEVELIQELGGLVVYITRPALANDDTHISENSVMPADCDIPLVNDGTLNDWRKKVLIELEPFLCS